ncbi:MAG: RNA polymerase sigma factor [Planctomycetota bacterium]
MAITTCAQESIRGLGMESPSYLPDAFWQLVEQYRGELVNQALAITGNMEDAEDVVQETFCEAFRDQAKIKNLRSLNAWLRTINHDNALDYVRNVRRQRKRITNKQQQSPDREYTTGGFSVLEMRDLVAKAIEYLSPEMRTAVVLCYWEHLTLNQIAERMQISSRTVRRLLFNASTMLYGNLKAYLPTSAENKPTESSKSKPVSNTNTTKKGGQS